MFETNLDKGTYSEIPQYQYCEAKNQRVALKVCDHNIEIGRCEKIKSNLLRCRPKREMQLTEEEKQSRSDRMNHARQFKKTRGRPRKAKITDTDTIGEVLK